MILITDLVTFWFKKTFINHAKFFHQAFLVDIYARGPGTSDNDIPDHIGMCYIYPDDLKQTMGKRQIPITSMKFQPIGKLTGCLLYSSVFINKCYACLVDYLMIHPIPQLEMDFSLSYRNYWADDWKGLDVGHRGLGNSYTKGHQ